MSDNFCVKPTFSIVETTKIGATIWTKLLKNSNIYIPVVVIYRRPIVPVVALQQFRRKKFREFSRVFIGCLFSS